MSLSNHIKSIVGISGNIFPLDVLIAFTGQKIVLPFYHSVTDKRQSHIRNAYVPRSVNQFSKDLDYLCKHYKPVTIEHLYENLISQKPASKIFHLTFDDGLSEIYHEAIPILEKKGIPATIFLNTGFIDNKEMFYRYKSSLVIESIKGQNGVDVLLQIAKALNVSSGCDKESIINIVNALDDTQINIINNLVSILNIDIANYLKKEQPYMNREQVSDLIKRGFSVGAHSVNHPHFFNLTMSEQKLEVADCFKYLQEQFGVTEKYFSFPFSDEGLPKLFFDWLYNDLGCKLTFGTSGLVKDVSPFHQHRVSMEVRNASAGSILKRKYMFYLFNSFLSRNQIHRR